MSKTKRLNLPLSQLFFPVINSGGNKKTGLAFKFVPFFLELDSRKTRTEQTCTHTQQNCTHKYMHKHTSTQSTRKNNANTHKVSDMGRRDEGGCPHPKRFYHLSDI